MPLHSDSQAGANGAVGRRRYFADDGTPEIELRFAGGFPARPGIEVIRWALGEPWTSNWRIQSLARQGDAAVVVLRQIEHAHR